MICPVCLGSGKCLDAICGWCNGLGFEKNLTKEEVIDFVGSQCRRYGMDLIMEESPNVFCGDIECSAFFCFKTKRMVVAKHSINFFENLLHEYCHLKQHEWNTKAWRGGFLNGVDSSDIIDNFISGSKVYSVETFKQAIDKTIELEWECENMVLEHLRHVTGYSEYQINNYQLNAYIYMRFYRAVEHFQKWHLPSKNFQSMGIHGKYIQCIKNFPNYNDPITQEEIDLVKECFV
jgi:hypothetical protein